MFIYGSIYASQQTLNVINPFWRDFLKAWSHFCSVCDIDSIQHILDSPIWFNTNFIQKNLFINDWCKNDVTNTADLLDEQGNFYQFETFKRIYNVRGIALDYQHLLNKIPVGWKSVINNNKVFTIENKFNTRCNTYISYLMQNKKGSRIFYAIIEKVNQLNVNDKWVAEVGDNDLRLFNASISKFKEVKLQDFQFKINNKIFITNYFLWKICKIDNNLSSYCKEHPEKNNHLFLTCAEVQEFWNSLKTWLYENANITENIEKCNIIFTYQGRNSLINYTLVLAKYYIYKTKFISTDKNLNILWCTVRLKSLYISGTKNNFSATKNNISGTKINFSPTKVNFSPTNIIFSGTKINFSPTKNTDF